MLRHLIIAALSCGFLSPALAQDPAANRWTGFYIGAHGGGGNGRLSGATEDLEGAIAGGHAGYNWQRSNVVLGIEADLSWSDYELSLNTALGGFNLAANASHDFFSSVRGRLGFADGPLMVYATAGVAYTEIETSLALTGPGVNTVESINTDVGGIVGGLGFEYAITPNLALRGESLWFDLHQDFDTTDPSYDGYFVRGGLSYYFR